MKIEARFTPSCMPHLTIGYVLTLPSDYVPGEQLPMIVFLHGAGERGTDLNLLSVTGLSGLFLNDPDYRGYRVITLNPQCPQDIVWNNICFGVKELIDTIAEQYHADPSHIALTGLSMGGYGTWDLATAYPNAFSCIAPICGGGITWRCGRIAHLPIRVFHSEHEQVVVSENSKLMVAAVNACGGHAELTLYDSADHNCWDNAYRNTDLIPWLMTASPAKEN